ncbi:hypothetical protein [Paenibacillus sp. WC2504]|uniref:hypothetical protein n=1 Tax=Paenibacillus sp. WC2504 TaxID=3461403 RepID=UPI004045A340
MIIINENKNIKEKEDIDRQQDFQNWLKNIQANRIDASTRIFLKADYYFANNWITYDAFVKTHNGLRINKWSEVSYLLRDSRICDLILKKLHVGPRRNILAALNGYTTDIEIARQLELKSSSQIGALLGLKKQPESFPLTITLLARLFDVTDEHIKNDVINHCNNHFNNYAPDSAAIPLSIFHSRIDESRLQYYCLRNDLPYFKSNLLYARIRTYDEFQSIEVYNLNENSNEIYDFRSCLDPFFSVIVITPALLRNVKKVIYYRALSKSRDTLEKHLHELSLRKYTRVIT